MFEPAQLRHSARDLLRAPRLALNAKQIGVQLRGLLLAYPLYFMTTYLALLLSGQPVSAIWDRYGLMPFFLPGNHLLEGTAAWVIFMAGVTAGVAILLVAGTAGSRIAYRELQGDSIYGLRDGWLFAWRNWRAVIFSPVTLLGIAGLMLLLAMGMALLGKLPYVGELIFIGLFPLYLLGAMFTLLTIFALAVLLAFAPAIVATTEDDAMGAAFKAFAAAWGQFWRALLYPIGVKLLAVLALLALGWALTLGYHFVLAVFGADWLMGDKLGPIMAWAEELVFPGYHAWFSYIPGHSAPATALTSGLDAAALSGWDAFTGSLMALVLGVVYLAPVAYGLAVISAGQTLAYLAISWRLDGVNLLERPTAEPDEEEDSEPSAGKAVEPDATAGASEV